MKVDKLESLRGMAAIYVMLGHVVNPFFGKYRLSILLSFGQEMVILFFILSGFVIYYSSSKIQLDSFQNFFVKRFRRIYPLFIISLLISYLLACIYQRKIIFINVYELVGNILMLQDFSTGKPGVWFNSFMGNPTLWSLSYEWWFYILFFIVYRFVPNHIQIFVAITISFIGYFSYFAYPNKISVTIMYFIIWWSGVEIAREYLKRKQITFTGQKITIVTLIGMCILLLFQILIYQGNIGFGIHPFLEFRHFCACLCIISLSIVWYKAKFVGFRYTIGWFKIFAPISYGIYILHYPIMVSFNLFGKNIISFLIVLCITLLLAYVLEIKLQKQINRISLKFMKVPEVKSI